METLYFGASWALTSACNYACTYCYKYDNIPLVSQQDACMIVDRLYNMGCRKLSLAGGEPLLWHSKPAVFALIKYMKGKGIKTELITNGMYLKPVDLILLQNKLDILTIDIDSLDVSIQKKMGRPEEHVSRSIELFNYAKELGMQIKTNTVVTSDNVDYVEGMIDFIKSNGFYKWKVYQFMPIEKFTDNRKELVVKKDRFEALRNKLEKGMQNSGIKFIMESNDQMADSYININPEGTVHTNELTSTGILKKHEIGNIQTLNIEQIFNHFYFDKEKFFHYHKIS